MNAGRLIYLVGASGAGKDTVLAQLRKACGPGDAVIIAHRYITRPVTPHGENHIALSPQEFAMRAAAGCFAMQWESHGLSYGIGCEVEAWLARGFLVLVNGSRAHLPEARLRFPGLLAVEITAAPHTIAARLTSRGRETVAEVAARIAHNARLAALPSPHGQPDARIANDGEPAEACAALLALLRGLRSRAAGEAHLAPAGKA